MPSSFERIPELFGRSTSQQLSSTAWRSIVDDQSCPFTDSPCIKTRKSEPDLAIGTCVVGHGQSARPIVICPHRFLERSRIFVDCIHLLTRHTPGNDFHVIPEFDVPGGSVDYVLASARGDVAVDFVGIEFQSLDTTGTVWPHRQALLDQLGVDANQTSVRPFGINWKMTAKTILIQLHHKIQTFENSNRHLVLVLQDALLQYLQKEFVFDHFSNPALIADALHLHSYSVDVGIDSALSLRLADRISTGIEGLELALALREEQAIPDSEILDRLSAKLSELTLFEPMTGA